MGSSLRAFGVAADNCGFNFFHQWRRAFEKQLNHFLEQIGITFDPSTKCCEVDNLIFDWHFAGIYCLITGGIEDFPKVVANGRIIVDNQDASITASVCRFKVRHGVKLSECLYSERSRT